MKRLFTTGMLLSMTMLFAQEEASEKKFSFSGSVDAYYRTNFTAPNDEDAIAPGSSFANLPGFALGMANVIASYEGKKVGFVADLVFGPRGTDAIFASPLYSATGDIMGTKNLFWLYFPECRYLFQNAPVYNPKNDALPMSFDDLFLKRRFSSYIHKESNVFDRFISQPYDGIDALLESERIKKQMFIIEHDLWSF